MQLQHRRTPCVGICSTTYGDLICRGCKRFAHEIVAWNGFSAEQQDQVWHRLLELRDGCVEQYLAPFDETLLREKCERLGVPGAGQPAASWATMAYEALTRADGIGLDALGLRPLDAQLTLRSTVRAAIDDEFYRRSVAHYERNFKTSFSP